MSVAYDAPSELRFMNIVQTSLAKPQHPQGVEVLGVYEGPGIEKRDVEAHQS